MNYEFNFSTEPIHDTTLLSLMEDDIQRILKRKIKSYLFVNGLGMSENAIDEIFYDFVAYMSGEGKAFNPEAFMSKAFKDYSIKPYLIARMDKYLLSEYNKHMDKKCRELNMYDPEEDDDTPVFVGCISSNLVGEDPMDFEAVDYDTLVEGYLEQARFLKSEYGLDVLQFMLAMSKKLGCEDKVDMSDVVYESGMSTKEFDSFLLKLQSDDTEVFAPESGLSVVVNTDETAVEFLEQLTGLNIGFIYATHVENGEFNPLELTLEEISATAKIPEIDKILGNILKMCPRGKNATTEYLSSLFATKGYKYTDELGNQQRISIKKLYQQFQLAGISDNTSIARNIIEVIKSTGYIDRMYILGFVSRLSNAKESGFLVLIKGLIKNLVPFLSGNSSYSLDDALAVINRPVEA